MTPSTNSNILGRDQLDWASLLYVDQVWYDGSDPTGVPIRSFVNPNDQPMFVFLQAVFVGGYSRISSNNFNIRYKANVAPIVEAGVVGYDLVATVYAYLYPGESYCLVAEREQQVPVNYTVSVSQRSIDPIEYAGSSGTSVVQTGTAVKDLSLPDTWFLLTYNGDFPVSDPNGFNSVGLPDGFSPVQIPSGLAYVYGVRNDTDRRYLLIDTSAHDVSSTADFQRVGDINGTVMVDGSAVRASVICTMLPGATYFYGRAFSGQANGRRTFVSLTFLPTDMGIYPHVSSS